MSATTHMNGEASDSERLLVQIVGEAHGDDGQLSALHRAIEAAVALPLGGPPVPRRTRVPCQQAAGNEPQWALQQYEAGVGIGQLSVGDDLDGVLPGELAGNRRLLRCLSGYGSCLWRLGRRDEAARAFDRALRLDPADRQGVRPLVSAMCAGQPWSDLEHS